MNKLPNDTKNVTKPKKNSIPRNQTWHASFAPNRNHARAKVPPQGCMTGQKYTSRSVCPPE